MNNSIRDKNLVDFVKQNRPNIPEAQPDLEQQIMAAIEEESSTMLGNRGKISNPFLLSRIAKDRRANYRLWILPSAMAASLLVAFSGYYTMDQARLSSSEEAHLEAFLVNNWEPAVDNYNLLPLSFPTDNSLSTNN